jgi:uncharacterized protein (TIRG00374 family)
VPHAAERGRHRFAWWLKLGAGVLLLWLAFHDVEPAAVGRAFAAADPVWLAAAVGSIALTVACAALRWGVLLGVGGRHAGVLAAGVIVSQVANLVMPFRFGDAVRIGAVSRTLAIPPAAVLASVAVERLFDVIFVALTAGALVAAGVLPPFARSGMLSLTAAIGLVLAALVIAVTMRPLLERALGAGANRYPRAHAWISRQLDQLIAGLARVAIPSTAARVFLLSAAVMSASILTAWLVLRASGLDAPAVSAAVVVIAVQIGGVVVPIPGAIGISQVITVQTLKLWDVPEAPALAYALLLYLVVRVPKVAALPFALSTLAVAPPEAP